MGEFAKSLGPALLICGVAACAGLLRGLAPLEVTGAMPAIFLLLAGYFSLARHRFIRLLSDWCRDSPSRIVLAAQAFLLPYLLYALPLGCFSPTGFLKLWLYVNFPLLALMASVRWRRLRWLDGAAVLLLWLPLDLRLLGPLWPWPPGQSGYFLFGILGVPLAVFLFVVVRGMEEVGYTFFVRRLDARLAVFAFLLFAPLAVGIGLLTGFIHPANRLPSTVTSVGTVLGVFLATGIPEELLFRGIIQNLIFRWTSSPAASVLLASLIFGAAHLNNGAHPDARYFVLATLAGSVYGWVYRRAGSLMAPALTHTFVNSVWALFFRS